MLYVVGFDDEVEEEVVLPPQAIKGRKDTHSTASHTSRRLYLPHFPPKRRIPARGVKPKYICAASQVGCVCTQAEALGTTTARLNETALLLGVTVAGVNVHDAPEGNVLCRHDSVIGS